MLLGSWKCDSAPGGRPRSWVLSAAALGVVEVVFSHTRGCLCARDVFFKAMHACKSVCVHEFFFISGCGYSRLALSVLEVMKTNSNNKKGEANEVLERRGVCALKAAIREGNSVPLSPAFAGPCVCFKLLQALQPSLSKRVSVRHLERGKGEGGLFLPFVCVWEEE